VLCCGVLQCVAVCCSVLQCAAVCCSVVQDEVQEVLCSDSLVCCSVLLCVAVRCIVLRMMQYIAACGVAAHVLSLTSVLQCAAVCCSVLQCVLQCVAFRGAKSLVCRKLVCCNAL